MSGFFLAFSRHMCCYSDAMDVGNVSPARPRIRDLMGRMLSTSVSNERP